MHLSICRIYYCSYNMSASNNSSHPSIQTMAVIFLHIARTGGLTMRSLIRRSYPPIKNNSYINLRHYELASLKEKQTIPAPAYVHAHFVGYGVHRFFSKDTKPLYITMLRNPVDRLRSILTYGEDGGFENLDHALDSFFSKTGRATHTEVQRNILQRARHDNMMTRTLGSVDGTVIPRDTNSCTEETFQLAVHRILNKIKAVMITERFDESVLLLQKSIGLRNPWYRQINYTKSDRLQSSTVPNRYQSHTNSFDDLRNYTLSRDHYDFRLYELALEHFNSTLSQEYCDIENHLLRYRHLNRFAGTLYKVWDRVMPMKLFYED